MRGLLAFALLGTLMGPQARAAEGVLPADVVAKLVRKVAPYERGYEKRLADGFVIAVVYSAPSDASRLEKDLLVGALELHMSAARVVTVSDETLASENGIDLMLLCEGVDLVATVDDAIRRGVLAIALRTNQVEDTHGVPMAFVARDAKPRILVNRRAANRAGITIDARLLGLSELVDANVSVGDGGIGKK